MTGAMKEERVPELPERVHNWIRQSVSPDAAIHSAERLQGSTSSTLHAVKLRLNGTVQEVVVRQYDNAKWLEEEPDVPHHEADSLRWANRAGLPAPQLLAFDPTGAECGMPALLMSRQPGSVWLLPADMEAWVHGLAEMSARIHRTPTDGFPWTYYTYQDPATIGRQTWSRCPDVWDAAMRYAAGTRPQPPERFLHRDYHPGNVLWTDGRVSGVVDWPSACIGPAGVDVGHCRVNLVELFGVETADAYLRAYEHFAGPSFQYDPYWDIDALVNILYGEPQVYPGWAPFGVTGLTDSLLRARLDDYVCSLMARI
ncbi:phosphotransferase family protein [Paenibacillus sp. HJGM_3]|uniref:phosphotransferase family protein n=1 Tax=Paenibacillus sp. HJGM_3 TaxID=3379816 RepID=UPI003867B127